VRNFILDKYVYSEVTRTAPPPNSLKKNYLQLNRSEEGDFICFRSGYLSTQLHAFHVFLELYLLLMTPSVTYEFKTHF